MSKIGKLRQRLAGIRDAKEPVPKRIRGFGDPLIESDADFKSRERQSDYMTLWEGTISGPNKEEVDYANRKKGWDRAAEKWEGERLDEMTSIERNQNSAEIRGFVKTKGRYKKPQSSEHYDSAHNEIAPRKPFGVGPLNRPITRSQTETPLLEEVPFGPMLKYGDRRRKPQRYRINEPAVPDLLSKRDPNPFRIRPRKPTQAERSEIITAKLRQRIAQVRLAAKPKKVASTKREVVNAMKEGKPMRTEKPLRHGERLPPTYETDGENFLLYGNKILSKQGDGYQTHVKGFINDDNYEQITLDTFRDFGIQVNSKGKIIPTKQFFTKDGLAMKIKTGGDLTKSDMVIPANEISDSRVLVNKYKPPTGIKKDTYPYTPDNLRNFAAESRRRATSMQVDSEGRIVPEGTLRGDPTGIRKRSLSETATQPEDAKTVNKMLGFPEEHGLGKTFDKKVKGKRSNTTKEMQYTNRYKGIEGSKTHHTLFKKKFKPRPTPVGRFKHTRNVKATPKGSYANPFANNPENAIQLSKPEHKELHRLNPHSNFRNIFESKLRLKIARIRQRNISRRVTQINMAKEDYDPENAWREIDLQLDRLEGSPGYEGNFTLYKGKLVNFEHEIDTLDLLDSTEGDPKHPMYLVSNTHNITNRKDPQLKTKFMELAKQGYNPTVGKWNGMFDATVNFRSKDRKQVEKIARGELDAFGKPMKNKKGDTLAQKEYVEIKEIPRKTPTGPREFQTNFLTYNEKTDTYEEEKEE